MQLLTARRCAAAILLVLAGGIAGFFALRPTAAEPTFQGRLLSEWAIQLYCSPDAGLRTEAEAFFQNNGEALVPHLLRLIQMRDSTLRRIQYACAAKLPRRLRREMLKGAKPQTAALVRAATARALGVIGAPAAIGAAPRLAANLRDADPIAATEAAHALAKIGAAGVDELTTALDSNESATRLAAVQGLSVATTTNLVTIERLISLLHDTNAPVRTFAGAALVNIGMPAFGPLLATFDHQDGEERRVIAELLVRIYPSARKLAHPLAELAQDSDPLARRTAVQLLKEVNAPNSTALDSLAEDADPKVREAARQAKQELAQRTLR